MFIINIKQFFLHWSILKQKIYILSVNLIKKSLATPDIRYVELKTLRCDLKASCYKHIHYFAMQTIKSA